MPTHMGAYNEVKIILNIDIIICQETIIEKKNHDIMDITIHHSVVMLLSAILRSMCAICYNWNCWEIVIISLSLAKDTVQI